MVRSPDRKTDGRNIMAETMGRILFTEEEILKRAEELGAQISEDYAGEELIVLGTLRGAVMWMCDLLKRLTLDTKIDFISASSYGSATQSSGVVRILIDDGSDPRVLHPRIDQRPALGRRPDPVGYRSRTLSPGSPEPHSLRIFQESLLLRLHAGCTVPG